MCPLNASVPIIASGIIPVAESDVADIIPIAFSIPDFEGQAILRIFANATESEIGCYSAVVTNGNTFSHPSSVGTVLGVFTVIALLASFATAIYGEMVPVMRLHYAHSLSVGVVFAVFQHIFFTGALSVNWPSVLVAWWSNFAWAGGMIYTSSMQASINHLIGNNVGNTSEVGAAGAGSTQEDLGGGYDISAIYKRNLPQLLKRDIASEIYKRDYSKVLRRDILTKRVEQLVQRASGTDSDGLPDIWYGHPVGVGLPLPGNYSGFAGTLAEEGIRVSNAFMTGFLWFLILLVILVAATIAFKWVLEALTIVRALRKERLAFFRQHWLGFAGLVAARTCFLAFFMMMFLTMFQFTYDSNGGVKGVAAIVFVLFLIGIPGAAAYACYYRIRVGRYESNPERFQTERKKLLKVIPWFSVKKSGTETSQQQAPESKSSAMPFWRRMSQNTEGQISEHTNNIHEDEDYTKKFGWLSARFRRTRWWFFTCWLLYEFLRACFTGAASGHALTQVFGLLVIEILAFAGIVWARPFEGRRLNVLVVYCLGFSKVTSVALSAAFDVQFNLQRITTTAIGIVIIVIQGILTIITLIAIVIGAISSYMSLTRNHEDFRPRKWAGLREKYFNHLDRVVHDVPRPPPPVVVPEEPKEPYFSVGGVRRMHKIEDDDKDFVAEMALQDQDPNASYISLAEHAPAPARDTASPGPGTPLRRSRAPSVRSVGMSQTNLPYGARQHRPSWSTREFEAWDENQRPGSVSPINMNHHVPEDEPMSAVETPTKPQIRAPSRSATLPSQMIRPAPSSDSLKIGGDISTSDMIGKVPAPTMRPRSNTANSRHSRSNTPTFMSPIDGRSTENLPAFEFGLHGDSTPNRGSRAPLTPAQEMEEWP